MSSRPADSAKVAHEYAGRFRSVRGLGNRVYTTVSQTAQISVFAIGHGFVLALKSRDPRVSEYMDLTIAQAVYASASK